MKLNREGVLFDAEARNKRNENWSKLEEEYGKVAKALPIAQSAEVLAQSVKDSFDKIIVDGGNSNIEIVDARGEEVTLGERLNKLYDSISSKSDEKKVRRSLKKKENKTNTLELIAHRGFAHLAPENTMTAFTMAHVLGSRYLECDVQISSDGVPVLFHDNTVERTTNGAGSVKDKTFSQLRSLDAGSKLFGPKFESSRIPSLDEFLTFTKGRSSIIYPEIKGVRTNSDIKLIVDLIKNHNMETITVLQSFSMAHLQEVRKESEVINFAFLSDGIPSSSHLDTLEVDGNSSLLVNFNAVLQNPGLVVDCDARGIELGVWTVDNNDTAKTLMELGVYKIMSNTHLGVAHI